MGFFGKIKAALSKTKEGIGKKLTDIFAKNKLGDEFYEELEDLLISSDVSVQTSMEIVEELKENAIKDKVKDKELVVRELKRELKETLSFADKREIKFPAAIMVVGVNGVGKTTTIGKLAAKFINEGKSVTIAAADTFRAAAADQLSVWADRAKVRIIKSQEGADAAAVVYDAAVSAKAKKTDVLIIDTAGRLHVKSGLMEELKKMDRVLQREYPEADVFKMIVLDATTGQNAYNQVTEFDKAVNLDGIILTKIDGTAKGGFIVSLSYETEIPVYYVGTGEKLEDIEDFSAEDFVEGMF